MNTHEGRFLGRPVFMAFYFMIMLVMTTGTACNGKNGGIKAPGLVDGEIISQKALVGGTVTELNLEEGQRVDRNQVIARLDSEKLDTNLAAIGLNEKEIDNTDERTRRKIIQVHANLEYLEKQTGRFERLSRNQSVSGEQLEKMRLQLLEGRTTLFDLEKTLENLKIQRDKLANQRQMLLLQKKDLELKAPVVGVVLERFISLGETVLPGTVVADILDTASLYVDVFVEEKEIAGLKLQERVKLLVDGQERLDLSGLITYFGRKAEFSPKYIISEKERQSLLYRVKIKIDRQVELFKIGMPLTVVFK